MKKLLTATAMVLATGSIIRGAPIRCAGTAANPLLTCDWNPDGALEYKLKISSTGPVALGGFNYIPSLAANPLTSPSGYWKVEFETFSEISAAIPVGAKVSVKGKAWHTFAPGAPAGHGADVVDGNPFAFTLGIEANPAPARNKLTDTTDFGWVEHPGHWDRMKVSLSGVAAPGAGGAFQINSFELKFEGIHIEQAPEPATAALLGAGLVLAGIARRVKIENHAKPHRRTLDLIARICGSHIRPRH